MPKAHESELTPKIGVYSQSLVDPLKLTPLSIIGPRYETQEHVMLLSKYKFKHSHLEVVKRTSNCRKDLVGGIEKPIMEGFEERIL